MYVTTPIPSPLSYFVGHNSEWHYVMDWLWNSLYFYTTLSYKNLIIKFYLCINFYYRTSESSLSYWLYGFSIYGLFHQRYSSEINFVAIPNFSWVQEIVHQTVIVIFEDPGVQELLVNLYHKGNVIYSPSTFLCLSLLKFVTLRYSIVDVFLSWGGFLIVCGQSSKTFLI